MLRGITLLALGASAGGSTCSALPGYDCVGSDIKNHPAASSEACCDLCYQTTGCAAWTLASGVCYMKTACPSRKPNSALTSGLVASPQATCQTISGYDCPGSDIANHQVSSAGACCDFCSQTSGCAAYTWSATDWMGHPTPTCYLKTGCPSRSANSKLTSGSFTPAPPPQPVGPTLGRLNLVQSARYTGDKLSVKADVFFYDDFKADIPVVDVSSTVTHQSIVGFGGAFTEAAAVVFQGMHPSLQSKLLEKYFDATHGIGYTIGRVHINSCDFSPSPAQWAEDEVENDYDLAHFDTEVKRDAVAMLPFIKAGMQQIKKSGRDLKLFASPWSPPAWMKTTGRMDGGGGLRPEAQASWANFFAKWITAYKEQGVPIWAVTPQNEPENPARWEACVYTADAEADWVGAHLGPTLNATHPEVLIFPFDHNKDHVYDWAKNMYSHPTASKYIDGIAFHWYSGDSFDHVAQIHSEYPQAMLLPTEATWEKYRWHAGVTPETGDWSFGEGYAHDIMGDLNAGSVGWTDWNLLLDQTGGPNHVGNNCDAPMMADTTKQELYLHPQYYYIGHFSKFLLPDSKRLSSNVTGSTTYRGPTRGYGSCDASDGLQATAFKRPDGRIAVVVLNCGGAPISFKLKDGARAALVTIPGHGIQTYMFLRASENDHVFIV